MERLSLQEHTASSSRREFTHTHTSELSLTRWPSECICLLANNSANAALDRNNCFVLLSSCHLLAGDSTSTFAPCFVLIRERESHSLSPASRFPRQQLWFIHGEQSVSGFLFCTGPTPAVNVCESEPTEATAVVVGVKRGRREEKRDLTSVLLAVLSAKPLKVDARLSTTKRFLNRGEKRDCRCVLCVASAG